MWPTTSTTSGPRSASTRSTTTAFRTAGSTCARTRTATPTICARRSSTRRTSRPTTRSSARCRARWRRSRCGCAGARPRARPASRTRPTTLRRLVARVRAKPVVGIGYDASGKAHHVEVDESGLLGILYDDYFADPAFLNQGEVFAAARALQAGDKTPLLRLAAESNAPTDFGAADGCAVGRRRLRRLLLGQRVPVGQVRAGSHAPRAVRAAAKAVPAAATAPFSVAAWTGFIASQPVLLIPGADACTPWPAPTGPSPRSHPVSPSPPACRHCCSAAGSTTSTSPGADAAAAVPDGEVRDGRQRRPRHYAVEPLRGRHRRPLPLHAGAGNTSCAADTRGATGNPFGGAAASCSSRAWALPAPRPGRLPSEARPRAPRREHTARTARGRSRVGRRRGRRLPNAAARRHHRARPARRHLQGQARQGHNEAHLPARAIQSRCRGLRRRSLDIATSRLTGRITVAGALRGHSSSARRYGTPTNPTQRCAGRSAGRRSRYSLPPAETLTRHDPRKIARHVAVNLVRRERPHGSAGPVARRSSNTLPAGRLRGR